MKFQNMHISKSIFIYFRNTIYIFDKIYIIFFKMNKVLLYFKY